MRYSERRGLRVQDKPRSPASAGSLANRIDAEPTCPPPPGVSSPHRGRQMELFEGLPGVAPPPRREAPHFVREPLEALLRVVQLGRCHLLRPPGGVARVRDQIVQHFAQRPVLAPLERGARAHAVWMPSARSSARWNSSAAARSVDATPCSAT